MGDGDLLEQYYACNVNAFEALVSRYNDFLLSTIQDILRHRLNHRIVDWDPADILDNVWVKAYLSKFLPIQEPRPDLNHVSVTTWLIGLVCREIDRRLGP